MIKTDTSASLPRFIMLASIAIVLAGLYFAQEVLIPLALATLFSFLLAPLVKRLERLRLPRAAAVLISVIVAFSLLAGVGWVVFNQLGDLKTEMPKYQTVIKKKVESMRAPMNWMRAAGEEVKQAINAASTTKPAKTAAASDKPSGATSEPSNARADGGSPSASSKDKQDVSTNESTDGNSRSGASPSSNEGSIFPGESAILEVLKPIGSFLLGPVGTAFIVTVFSIFMLLQREDLRDRLIRLVGRDQLTTTTQALDDAAERVSRYLLMQSIVNGSVGVIILLLLWFVGKINGTPFPAVALWGLLAALLRFIPYIGIWIAAVTPIILSLAVFTTFKVTLETMGVYLGVELIAANVLEPLLFGSSTGIATLAVLVAAAFWTWLWGPVGLLLSTPLTVCLVVMGKYVPQLEFLTILLAEEPALSPPDRIYQRLLALDQEEAAYLIADYCKTMPLEAIYETVLLPALAMAEQDFHQGNLDETQHRELRRGVRDIIDELADQTRQAADKADTNSTVESQPPRISLPKGCVVNVVCLPANDESDEIVGLMLAQLLEMRGYCPVVVSVTQLASEMVSTVQNLKADVVCISALPPAAVTHARYLCKKLQGNLPGIEVMVGLWNVDGDLKRATERLTAVRSVQVASTLTQAIEQIHQMAQPKMIAGTAMNRSA